MAHGEHDLALRDVALGEKPRVGAARFDALQFAACAGGHDDGQTGGCGVVENGAGVVAVIRANDGVATVGALLGVCQGVGQLFEVLGIFIVEAQVNLHLLALGNLCPLKFVEGHVHGVRQLAVDDGRIY